jgi:hypothetical protein
MGLIIAGSVLFEYIQFKPTIDRLISGGGTVNPLEASNQNRNLTEEIQRDLWEQFKPPGAKSYDEAKKAFETPQSVLDWRKWRDQ